MKKLIIPLLLICLAFSCEKVELPIQENIQTKSGVEIPGPPDDASFYDESSGGGGGGYANGIFAYPNGWCYVEHDGRKCKVTWTNGLPVFTSFSYTHPLPTVYNKTGVISQQVYFTVPQEELTARVVYYMYGTINPQISPYCTDVFTFRINIPQKKVTIEEVSPNYVNQYISRSYNMSSSPRYYRIMFRTDIQNSTIDGINIDLYSHGFHEDPLVTYTYTINNNNTVTFNIRCSVVLQVTRPNGSSSLMEIESFDEFEVNL